MKEYRLNDKGLVIQELLNQIKNKTLYSNATTENAGLMSAEDKSTLNTLNSNMGESIQQINELNNTVSQNSTAIEANAGNIATNTSDISTLNTTTGGLATRLSAAEDTLANIFQLDANNFMGIYANTQALEEIQMTGAGWALVGEDLTELLAYVWNIPAETWEQYGETTYDYSDYSGLVSQVATIGSKIGDLSELETTAKTDLVSAINEVKESTEASGERTVDLLSMLPAYTTSYISSNVWASRDNQKTYFVDISGYVGWTLKVKAIEFGTNVSRIAFLTSDSHVVGETPSYDTAINTESITLQPNSAEVSYVIPSTSKYLFVNGYYEEIAFMPSYIHLTKEADGGLVSHAEFDGIAEQFNEGEYLDCKTVEWYSGNFNNYAYSSAYANRVTYYMYVGGYPLDKIKITKPTTFTVQIKCYSAPQAASGVATREFTPSSTRDTLDLSSLNVNYIRLLMYDKPTTAQAQAETFSMTFQEAGEVTRMKEQVAGNTQAIETMQGKVAKEISLSAADGSIFWLQGGINGSTGKVEANAKAIHTKFIKIYKTDVLSPLSYTNTIANTLRYAVYNSDYTFKAFTVVGSVCSSLDTDYGYVRLCFYGANAIDRTSDNATTAVWNITRNIYDYYDENGKGYMENPIYLGDTADPCLVNGGDGYWYCFRTIGTTGKFLRSANLIDWEIGESFLSASAIETLSAKGSSFWAFEVKKIGGMWNMYMSVGTAGMFVLQSRNIWGKYDVVREISSKITATTQRIDACVEYAEDGQLWMFWGSIGGICRIKLTDDGTDILEGEVPEKITPTTSTNANGWEGTYLYRRNGYWYLFCSNGEYGNYTYNIQVVRSETLAGSFVDKDGNTFLEGNATRILYSESGDELYGPGHNGAIMVDKDNRTWMFYHCHVIGTMQTSSRPLCIGEVLWDEDGWPYFEGGKPSIKLIERPTF